MCTCLTCSIQSASLEMGDEIWFCDHDKRIKTRLGIAAQLNYYFQQIGRLDYTREDWEKVLWVLYKLWKYPPVDTNDFKTFIFLEGERYRILEIKRLYKLLPWYRKLYWYYTYKRAIKITQP